MFTGIDHVVIAVPDLPRAIDQYHKLGFNVYPGGAHPGMGTHNAIALNQDDYLELLAIRDPAEQKTAAARPGSWVAGMADFIAAGGGIRYVVLQSDDLAADVAAMRSRGVDVSDAVDGSRLTASRKELRWRLALLGPKNPLPIFFIQHSTPMAERRKQVAQPMKEGTFHPNGVYTLERTYIVTENVESAAAMYAKVLGLPQPAITPGTVIMSNMAVFQIGAMGLSLAQPSIARPAWVPLPAGSKSTACRLSRAAFAIPASTPCWLLPQKPAGPTSASSVRSKKGAAGEGVRLIENQGMRGHIVDRARNERRSRSPFFASI
jgi:catechol 2,3-dioxygenase-like lactoylglutathione lyase family enzyme